MRNPLFFSFVLTVFVLANAAPLLATNHYILAGATGNGSGTDWANACTAFSGSCSVSSLVRGDIYYVGSGTYAGPSFNKSSSGTTLITIKSATVSDHGTSTGWSDSFAGLSTFTGGIDFTTGYWVFDGVTGGGPGSWTSGFGFAVTQTGSNPVIEVDNGANFVTVRHVKLTGNSNSSGGGSIAQDAFAIKGGTNFKASYFYTNAIGRCPFFCGGVVNACPSMIAEYGYIGTYVSTSTAHSEVLSDAAMAGDIDFRYNLITHIEGTGGLMWDNAGNHNAQFRVYGNVFYRASGDNSWANTANGIIGGWTGNGGEDNYNMHIYNNTFVNVNGTIVFTNFINRFGNNVVENNLFYNTTAAIDYADIATHDYNDYVSSGGTHSEANGTSSSSGSPLIDITNLNFGLLLDTAPGIALASPYDLDPLGVVRGSDGVWNRGAFQGGTSTGGGSSPAPPTALTALVQ